MGVAKTEGLDIRVTEMADVFKVIGHPGRLAILEYLAKSPSCICNDIVDDLPFAQPTISKHLSELKRVGLIKGTISGKNVCYCIDEEKWYEVREAIDDIARTLVQHKECC